jgi:formate dehydrogenase maturation protein FdhE
MVMVDFDNESTVTKSVGDLYKIIILQRKYDVDEQIEKYIQMKAQNPEQPMLILKSRVYTLWLQLAPMIFKRMKDKEKAELKKKFDNLEDLNEKQILELVYYLNDFIYNIGITHIDTKKKYDTTSAEAENLAYGL